MVISKNGNKGALGAATPTSWVWSSHSHAYNFKVQNKKHLNKHVGYNIDHSKTKTLRKLAQHTLRSKANTRTLVGAESP